MIQHMCILCTKWMQLLCNDGTCTYPSMYFMPEDLEQVLI